MTHHHAATRHPRDRHRQRDGERHGQALGYGRHRESDGAQQHLAERLTGCGPQRDDHHAQQESGTADAACEALHASEQRWRLVGHGDDLARDGAELGGEAGRDDESLASPRGRHAAREGHVPPLRQGGRFGQHHRGVLLDRRRLAREERFVDAQIVLLDQPDIGGDAYAAFEQQQIAGHHLLGCDVQGASVPVDPRPAGDEARERAHLTIRTRLVHEADQRVEDQHAHDEAGVGDLAEQHGDGGRRQQHVDERAAELPQHQHPARRGRRRLDAVAAAALQSLGRLLVSEPGPRGVDTERGRVAIERVPRDCGRGLFRPRRGPVPPCARRPAPHDGANVDRPTASGKSTRAICRMTEAKWPGGASRWPRHRRRDGDSRRR
jgi:hypothetical protein